jgi:hypothetical protein
MLHDAGFASRPNNLQIIKSDRGEGKTCESGYSVIVSTYIYYCIAMYIETFGHRECWVRLSVTFDAARHVSTIFLHNLLPNEREFIKSKLEDETLQPFSLHPLFVPVLILELLFHEAIHTLGPEFGYSIHMYINANLHVLRGYELPKHDLDIEEASEDSLRHEQSILILFEKIESAIKIGTKVLNWFGTFDTSFMSECERKGFQSADAILRNRMEYLVEGFELQLIRLRRTQGHAQLNRLGVFLIYSPLTKA